MPIKKIKTYADKLYNDILKYMENVLGNSTTYSDVLQKAGISLLGHKFMGVFPSDKIPNLNQIKPYAIVNLDKSGLPGTHWVALAYNDNDGSVMVYDSYGRKTSKILPYIMNMYGGRIVQTDNDPEQRLKENNCGQRALTWLKLYDLKGPELAIQI